MDRFMDKIGDAIAPIAQKMTANRYLSAIKEGFFWLNSNFNCRVYFLIIH